jgi:2-polyprenyl-6-methoxyphenol hydroxylase-like FAD-dependent oxidoreductase
VWLGTSKVFEAFTFAFTRTPAGWIWFHAYAFSGEASTFIVECTPQTWAGLGFDRLGVDDSLRLLERIFERHLEGHRLLVHTRDDRTLAWLRFRSVSNGRWHHGNLVLMGTPPIPPTSTIGSGTKLAVEDAIALAERLDGCADLATALEEYGTQRRADLALPQRDAAHSAQWFEHVRAMSAWPLPNSRRLLRQRRSRLLPHLPPPLYYRLYRATGQIGVWRRLWELASS